jgi:hypothetical protein
MILIGIPVGEMMPHGPPHDPDFNQVGDQKWQKDWENRWEHDQPQEGDWVKRSEDRDYDWSEYGRHLIRKHNK